MKQFFGLMAFNNNYPFLQTVLVGVPMRIGKLFDSDNFGVFLYAAVQMVVFAAVLAGSIAYMGKLRLPYWFRAVSLAFYAFLPVFPGYAIAMGKDTNFGFVILLYMILLIELVRNPEHILVRPWMLAALGGVLLLIALLRNAGIYLVLLSIPHLLYLGRKRLFRITAVLGMVFLVFGLYSQLILPVFAVKQGSVRENWSIPFQQTARFVRDHSGEVTEAERAAIDRVLHYDLLAENYDPEISDAVKNTFKEDASPEAISAYFAVWRSHFFRHPLTYLQATMNNSYGYLYPDDDGRSKPFVLWGLPKSIFLLKGFSFSQAGSPETIKRIVDLMRSVPGVGTLLRIGFYSWTFILAVAYLSRKRQYRYLIPLIPILFVLLGCIASPVNAYFRYALPIVMAFPMIISVCLMESRNGHQ